MKLQMALVAIVGLLIGVLGGGYLGFAASQWFVGTMFSSQLESRMVEHVVLLKLLDDGKTESVRRMLLTNVQSDTIVVGSVATGETGQRLLRFAR